MSLKIAVVGGSSTETAAQRGSAQLLASSAFSAGSQSSSGLKIVRHLESLGARLASSSDREKIVYEVTTLADRVEPVVATVLDVIGSPLGETYVLAEAKEQAKLHYDAYAADTAAQIKDLVHEAAFGEASALGNNGLAHNLKKLDVSEVIQYRNAHFVKENIVVASSGGVSAATLKQLVQASGINSKSAQPVSPATSAFIGGEIKVRADLDGNTNLAVAFPAPAGEAGKAYQVLAAVLSSRVAAQSICAAPFSFSYSKSGLIGVRTTGTVAVATEQLTKILAQLKAIAAGASETDVVKNKVALENFLALEGEQSAGYLINSLLAGVSPAALADVRGVTAQQVSDAAKAVLKATPAYAVLGATAGTPTYGSIQKLLA